MRLLINLCIISVLCVIVSNAFLFGHKFKDGCDPNPCKHDSKCILDSKNKNISTCNCTKDYAGAHCEFHVGCHKNPCGKHGKCENLKENATLFHCTCDKDYVGDRCEAKNPCTTPSKPPCTSPGSVCHVDDKTLKAVCDCPIGFTGKKCDQRNCTIVEFKNFKNFASKPKMYVDSEVMKKWTDLDGLAGLCGVKIQPIRTFVLQPNVSSKIEYKDYPFYTGRGLQFEILDKDGKLFCNSICLSKTPIPLQGAKCFMDGLLAIQWKYSVLYPGVINDGSHMYTMGYTNKDYNLVRTFKQVGCKDLKM